MHLLALKSPQKSVFVVKVPPLKSLEVPQPPNAFLYSLSLHLPALKSPQQGVLVVKVPPLLWKFRDLPMHFHTPSACICQRWSLLRRASSLYCRWSLGKTACFHSILTLLQLDYTRVGVSTKEQCSLFTTIEVSRWKVSACILYFLHSNPLALRSQQKGESLLFTTVEVSGQSPFSGEYFLKQLRFKSPEFMLPSGDFTISYLPESPAQCCCEWKLTNYRYWNGCWPVLYLYIGISNIKVRRSSYLSKYLPRRKSYFCVSLQDTL